MHFFLFLLSICYFQPPAGWECCKPEEENSSVLIGCLGKAKNILPPSLNLAREPTDLSLKEYVKAVIALHDTDLHVVWRDLGEFTFRGGKGRLGEISNQTPFGEIKMVQGILLKGGFAYILTGAALKEEFPEYRSSLLASLRSLELLPDLFSAIANPQSRESLKKRFDQLASSDSPSSRQKEWESLQEALPKEFGQLGPYWIYLALQEGMKRILWTERAAPVE